MKKVLEYLMIIVLLTISILLWVKGFNQDIETEAEKYGRQRAIEIQLEQEQNQRLIERGY